MNMKLLITGGTGMLGHKLVQRLSSDFEVFATIRSSYLDIERFGIFDRSSVIENVDLSNEADIRRSVETVTPDAVINAAGVIKQIPTSKDVITTLTVNSILPHRLAALSSEFGFRLIVVSTDCVFSGSKGNYSEADPADALDLYGRSKNLGEVSGERCLTLRTSIIGRELSTGHSLVEWFLSNRGSKLKGFRNAIYSGFPTLVFADIISNLLSQHPDLSGIYHVSGDPIDKFALLELVNDAYQANIDIEPDDDFKIDRSLDSTRFRRETGFQPRSWPEMIERMAADRTPYDSFHNERT
jgi:dTDP-4-dehydrorhamnose reductase